MAQSTLIDYCPKAVFVNIVHICSIPTNLNTQTLKITNIEKSPTHILTKRALLPQNCQMNTARLRITYPQ